VGITAAIAIYVFGSLIGSAFALAIVSINRDDDASCG
jgi:hypothetical protein